MGGTSVGSWDDGKRLFRARRNRGEEDLSQLPAGDFLRKDARTPLLAKFPAADILLSLQTNSPSLLKTAEEALGKISDRKYREETQLRLWVDPSGRSAPPWPKPYFRGLGHYVYAGFDDQNSLLIDLRTRSVIGRFTPAMAEDRDYWKSVVFPVLLTALAASVGLTVLHCACVSWKGSGLLLAGPSRSGKSTLSLALSQAGFDFLSDDRTVLSCAEDRLLAWRLTPFLKLRPEAAAYFPKLESLAMNEGPDGEQTLRIDPVNQMGVSAVECCEPRWVLFLSCESDPGFDLSEISPHEAARNLERGLHREFPEAMKSQQEVIRNLADRPSWRVRYGGDPHAIVPRLRESILGRTETRKTFVASLCPDEPRAGTARPDPLRRFTSTPLTRDLPVMGRVVRLETNSGLVLNQACRAFRRYPGPSGASPQFVWKIVTEPDGAGGPPWPEMTAFSNQALRQVNLGRRSFIAVDLEAREAVAFIRENLAQDEAGFVSIFLSAIFYLTAAALDLTPMTAACVATEGRGLLVFGDPGSGKTSASYLASKLGLEFHSDQAVFLELPCATLRAWGEFWPAAFSPNAVRFFPELTAHTLPYHHRDATFLCVDKDLGRPAEARAINPVACIFLERNAADAPRLVPLPAREFSSRLAQAPPFKDDAGSEIKRRAVFSTLGRLPAYRLLYGRDPSVAASFFRSVLRTHKLVEETA